MRMKFFVAALLFILAAGPAYPQNKDILRLEADMIMLQQQVKQLQSTVDENNGAIKGLVEKIADQVNTLAGGLQKVNQTLDQAVRGVRNPNENTAQEKRTSVSNLNNTAGQLQGG